jgi:hypothetical protein|tara:strand:- start:9789 stop:10388 length:600 start_codon:yes stop_codon:yes gene_type:complete
MSRLIAFGCSFTRGTALDDVWDFKNKCSIFPQPSKYAWPQLLADKLDIECINLGKGGYSNKAIWHTITNFDFNPSDIVFIHWSYLDRYHYYENKETGHIIDHRSNTARDKAFFKYLHSDYDMLNDLYMRINHIDSLLYGKKRYHLQIDPIISPAWNKTEILNIRLDDYKNKYPRANDKSHPGALAHKEFATALLQNLKN